jgi:hypothetical protein
MGICLGIIQLSYPVLLHLLPYSWKISGCETYTIGGIGHYTFSAWRKEDLGIWKAVSRYHVDSSQCIYNSDNSDSQTSPFGQ